MVHLSGTMLLAHFGQFAFTGDPTLAAELRRTIRDNLHYHEDIVRAAEEAIERLGGHLGFSCLQLRRNRNFLIDKQLQPYDAKRVLRNTEKLFRRGERLYVATEVDGPSVYSQGHQTELTPFNFSVLAERYQLSFLTSYWKHLGHVHPAWSGPIEQMVCARARVFVGTAASTFATYIQRMRGYMADVRQKELFYHHLRFPDDYRSELQMPWADHLSENREVWEGTVTPIFR